jgi:hypothetical protein
MTRNARERETEGKFFKKKKERKKVWKMKKWGKLGLNGSRVRP